MEIAWREGGFEPPKVLYAVNPNTGETYLVIEDDSTIYKIISSDGIIYMIAAFRCSQSSDPNFLNGTSFYTIDDPILHVVMCSKIESDKDRYAHEYLIKKYL